LKWPKATRPRTKPKTSWLATVAIAAIEQRQARLNCNKELFCNRQQATDNGLATVATVATMAIVACIMQQAAKRQLLV